MRASRREINDSNSSVVRALFQVAIWAVSISILYFLFVLLFCNIIIA